MKKMIKYSNHFGFVLALCAMVISGCSCSAPKPTRDPLVGWKLLGGNHYDKINKLIIDDYQDYIRKLPPEESFYAKGSDLTPKKWT